jgi:putative transposase
MPRKPRIHAPGAFYHVTLRGNHRQDIFFVDSDRAALESIVADVIQRFRARVHAYCWMTNHIHLMVQVGEMPLGRVMLCIASRYARQVQARFKTTGHLFECRYHAVLVDADEYLLHLIRYVHLNPVAAKMVSSPDEYRWSSHHAYLGARQEAWVTTDFALRLLHADPARAMTRYRHLISELIDAPNELPVAEINPNDTRVLGNDDFLANVLKLSWKPKSHKTLDMLVAEACEQVGTTLAELQSTRRHPTLARARAWVAHQATTMRIASIAHVARLFGRDESTVRESMRRYFGQP